MKKGVLLLFTISLLGYLSTGVLFAQTPTLTPVPTSVTPTVVSTITQSPGSPTTTPTPKEANKPTPIPTAAFSDPTPTPGVASQIQKPTPTPTHIPPTPTPKSKPLLLLSNRKPPINNPPVAPLNTIITAPFDLVMNSLPGNYYNDEGLSLATTKTLLALGSLSLLSGIILLAWPSLVRAKKRFFLPVPKERKSLPYLAGRA